MWFEGEKGSRDNSNLKKGWGLREKWVWVWSCPREKEPERMIWKSEYVKKKIVF
jgi:hypothetical protein